MWNRAIFFRVSGFIIFLIFIALWYCFRANSHAGPNHGLSNLLLLNCVFLDWSDFDTADMKILNTAFESVRRKTSETESIKFKISSKTSRGKRTAQKDTIIDITSDSQVNSNFPYRWSPASLTFNNYFYLCLYLYITRITINNNATPFNCSVLRSSKSSLMFKSGCQYDGRNFPWSWLTI